jgi:SAM-dependent methyltransferase
MNAPREVVPLVMNIVKPSSILDVGCGTGTWLKAFEEIGVSDYVGVDGDYVQRDSLQIPNDKFFPVDLCETWSLNRKFDLAISLEVAEHLPESIAHQFVATLVSHADTILFSAAVPGQGGQHHVNEQWPLYWQEKFCKHGFYFHDVIRPLIWDNEKVEWWYRQNIFLLKKEKPAFLPFQSLALVHPQLLELKNANEKDYLLNLMQGKQGLRLGFTIFTNTILYKIRNLLQEQKNG